MHIYTGADGRRLPSVTRIIRDTKPVSEIIRFQKAKENKMLENGWDERTWDKNCEIGRNRGTLTHAYAEWYFPRASASTTSTDKETESVMRHWESLEYVGDYVRQFNQFICDLGIQSQGDWSLESQEVAVVHDELGYGGRYDFRLRIGDQVHLFDIKTSKGYYSKWKQKMVYEWNEWRRPKNEPVLVEKKYKNGKSRMIRAKDKDGKPIMEKEAMPPKDKRDWKWVSSFVEDPFLQLALYTMAMKDEAKRRGGGRILNTNQEGILSDPCKVDCANVLVLFPERYQLIRLPSSIWSGCKGEAIRRVKQFYNGPYQRWALEAKVFNEKPELREESLLKVDKLDEVSALVEGMDWSLPDLPF